MANYVLSRHLYSIGTASCVKILDILLFTEYIPMGRSTFQRAFYISSAKVPKFAKSTVNQYEPTLAKFKWFHFSAIRNNRPFQEWIGIGFPNWMGEIVVVDIFGMTSLLLPVLSIQDQRHCCCWWPAWDNIIWRVLPSTTNRWSNLSIDDDQDMYSLRNDKHQKSKSNNENDD